MSVDPQLNEGKASVLMGLRGRLHSARIPDCVLISWRDWRRDREFVLARTLMLLTRGTLAVRSARVNEDHDVHDAGRYLSLLDVPARSDRLAESIDRVFDSYDQSREDDGVLVQPQIPGVRRAFVASTCGAWSSAYHSISFTTGPAPDAITRGDSPAETWHVLPYDSRASLPGPVARAFDVLLELCGIFDSAPFEIELVEDADSFWLLQVRPLPGDRAARLPSGSLERAASELNDVHVKGASLLGLMPDWNTAELLGAHPRPLALTLFQTLIGEEVWWRARNALGYARPYTNQLIQSIAGRPYIDVRASFESLCPAALPEHDRRRLVDAWIARLRCNPVLHDRIEFEIVLSGIEFDSAARLEALDCKVSAKALLPALRRISLTALDRNELEETIRTFTYLLSEQTSATDPLAARLQALADMVSTAFARAARCDFLVQSLWHSAARRGAISAQRCLSMLADASSSIPITGNGAARAARPSQFDIRSVMSTPVDATGNSFSEGVCFRLSEQESSAIAGLLRELSLPWSADELVTLARLAARARELGKRTLAALLGDWMSNVRHHGMQRGIDVEALSWLSWQEAIDENLDKAEIDRRVADARLRHRIDAHLKMPMLLAEESELRAVCMPSATGHFHGRGVVEAPLVLLDSQSGHHELPAGSIIAIASADPGFEWIFSRRPRALITAFGGPHSHMALRCADVGCGAVLGLGSDRFDRLIHASHLRIDFDQDHIEVVSVRADTRCQRVA
jgi:glutamine kinase